MPRSEPRTGRDLRQRDLVPPARLAACHAVVIGTGSIGRQVAVQLAATGVPAMTLYDPDTVAVENLAVQGFWESDLGLAKVDAVGNVCHQSCPHLDLHTVARRFGRSDPIRAAGPRTATSSSSVASIRSTAGR